MLRFAVGLETAEHSHMQWYGIVVMSVRILQIATFLFFSSGFVF